MKNKLTTLLEEVEAMPVVVKIETKLGNIVGLEQYNLLLKDEVITLIKKHMEDKMTKPFTPLNKDGQRLKFDYNQVQLMSGSLDSRKLGKVATIKINDTVYDAYGVSCDLENCNCDIEIIEKHMEDEE